MNPSTQLPFVSFSEQLMRRLLLLALLFASGPAWAANVTATTGWVCTNSTEPNAAFGALTIDAGSNRKLVLVSGHENNTDPAPTVTVGGVAQTELIGPFQAEPGSSPDQWHYVWLWDESEIAGMTGTTISYSDATTAVTKFFCYGTVEDTDQGALTAFDDTDVNAAAAQLVLTTTSNVGDLVLVTGISDASTGTVTFTGVSEIHDDTGGDAWSGAFGVGNADSVTIDWATSNEVSAAALVLPDATVSGEFTVTPGRLYTIDFATDGPTTIYVVAVTKDSAVPTADQIRQGLNGSGEAADAANSKAVNGAETIFLLLSAPLGLYDIWAVLADAEGEPPEYSYSAVTRVTGAE